MVASGFPTHCLPTILPESHLSSLVWLRLFLSPPQGCVVCSWSRETSVILTEPRQMPHSNKQHPCKYSHSSDSFVTATLAQTLHPHLPALPPAGDSWLHLPASPCSHTAGTGPTVPVSAVKPSRLEQESLSLGDAKKGLSAELQVVSTCCAVSTSPPLWLGTGLEWLILSIMGKAHRTASPPLGYERVFLEEASHLALVIFRNKSLRKWCGH